MRNVSSMSAGAPVASSIALETIWDVDEDRSYVVTRAPQRPGHLIAARTLAGTGLLELRGRSRPLSLGKDTLCVFDLSRVAGYRCDGNRWRFWWFEFRTSSAVPCELETVLNARPHPDDERAFEEAYAALRQVDPLERGVASAGFAMMLHRWLAHSPDRAGRVPHAEAVRRVIDLMHQHAGGGLTLSAMADAAHLGERRFRQVFAEATGTSPKRFYENLRLEHGRALLQLGLYTVGEIADRLGFSSPFHFSREFKKLFGMPPSHLSTDGART